MTKRWLDAIEDKRRSAVIRNWRAVNLKNIYDAEE